VVWAYAAHLGKVSDGASQFIARGDDIFFTTGHHDTTAVRDGWPESPYQAHTKLYQRLWNDVLVRGLSVPEAPLNLEYLVKALSGDTPERRDAWESVRTYAAKLRPTPETDEDIGIAAARAGMIVGDLIAFRRELLIKTGQPCYRVFIERGRSWVTIGNTDTHMRMREADFTHPVVYPDSLNSGASVCRSEIGVHYFSGMDKEGLLTFLDGIGVNPPKRLPKFTRFEWATHREDFDGLELDRVARTAIYEAATMVNSQFIHGLPVNIMRERRGLYDAFFNLRDFLSARHDPEETGDHLWELLNAFAEEWIERDGKLIMKSEVAAFLRRGLDRFADRPVGSVLAPPTGILPSSP
jgi:hypothetical protein